MKIVQLLPELNQGGVERGTIEFSRELVKCGHQSIVISAGGSLALQIENDGGKHITFDVCYKNPLTVPSRIYKLQTAISKLQPDILHARSRVPAWLTWFANKKLSMAELLLLSRQLSTLISAGLPMEVISICLCLVGE